MSFFTSLTGLNAATTQLSVTSNNIANAGTTGFKRSRSDFGDIFATSPLQKASTVVGQGTSLKQVTQEFSQGNIELSGNSLDLAVTGEGFFPLRSADGQDLYTRNGSFLLDGQNTVVNSAGQFLQVASVDSLGKADFKTDLVPLTIAPQTVGEAVATSKIDFSINFPAESLPKTEVDENNLEKIKPFNPDDPSTYAKSAATTIFDENGNDFLATFYYRRVQVASSQNPENKWQTHVVLDGQEITPALGQATTRDGRALFVDKYGNTVPEDELPVVLNDNLVYQKYNQDDLSEPEVSLPATARGGLVEKPYLSDQAGVDFGALTAAEVTDLANAFSLTIDENPNDVNATQALPINLTALTEAQPSVLSGTEVAEIMQQEINRQFGDQRFFKIASPNDTFRVTYDATPQDDSDTPVDIDVVIPAGNYTDSELAAEIEKDLTAQNIEVKYDRATKGFAFTPAAANAAITIKNVPGGTGPNTLFGLNTSSSQFTLDSRGRYNAEVIPNGDEVLPRESGQQRYGIRVQFLPNTEEGGSGGRFAISSGTTGDTSAIRLDTVSDTAKAFFGFDSDDPSATLDVPAAEGTVAVRGVQSTSARVAGKPISIDPDETFPLDELNNQFTVTVDNVTETFRLPAGNYNLNGFKNALENRINAMEDARGNSISGVRVEFNQEDEIFTFQSGTTGDASFFQISGPSQFGLSGIDSDVGQTNTYRAPVSEQTPNARPIFVTKDENGVFREYSSDPTSGLDPLPGSREFTSDPEFRPLFLDKGELTFDTSGNLISPRDGISLDNVVIGGSGNTLNIDIDYEGSTQFSGDFSVNSQSQNGQPNGSLVAVDIADDGLVTASYSNGTQDLKGKVVLGTFSTPNGLRQLGDSTFLESNESGEPQLGEPGGAGFGTIRAGARERANVDLTSELVDLITAQRNFQANAKAIETSSTLTSTIINIRS
jgi:flagellar hook-basal body protein